MPRPTTPDKCPKCGWYIRLEDAIYPGYSELIYEFCTNKHCDYQKELSFEQYAEHVSGYVNQGK